jgi:hypothetical protein
MVSSASLNEGYEEDIDALTQICGKHLLTLKNEHIQPMLGYPCDYIELAGDIIELIQKTEFISPATYKSAKDSFQHLIPKDVFKRIQGAEPKDTIKIINGYIASKMPAKNLATLMTESVPGLSKLMNVEAKFKCICLGLDLFGYRQEKKNKAFTNIDTDASHIFYSSYCDYFVTEDKKLAAKADAIYSNYNIQTKIIHPNDLEELIKEELSKEYSFEYMLSCINSYGIPRMEDNDAHYKLMRTPIFGLFDTVYKADESLGYKGNSDCGLFRYSFQNTPYLYYTELYHFSDFFDNLCPKDLKEQYHKQYVEPKKSGNLEMTSKACFILNYPDLELIIYLRNDPLAFVPCPMMQIVMGSNTLELIKKLKEKYS